MLRADEHVSESEASVTDDGHLRVRPPTPACTQLLDPDQLNIHAHAGKVSEALRPMVPSRRRNGLHQSRRWTALNAHLPASSDAEYDGYGKGQGDRGQRRRP